MNDCKISPWKTSSLRVSTIMCGYKGLAARCPPCSTQYINNIIKLFLKLGSCFPSSRATDCPNVLPPPRLIKHHLPSVGYWRCLWRFCSSSHRGIIIFFFSEALVVNLHCALSSLNYPSLCGEQTVLVWVEQIGNKWPTTTHNDVFPPCFQFCCAVCLGTQNCPKKSAEGTHLHLHLHCHCLVKPKPYV